MPKSDPVRLFHITAIANLPAICRSGALQAKNALAAVGAEYENIAYQGAQSARVPRSGVDLPVVVMRDWYFLGQ